MFEIITASVGAIAGGLFRLAPEVLKLIDRKDERKHEAVMADKAAALEHAKAASTERLAATQAEQAVSVAELQAIIEATRAQGQLTGVKWVDAINSLVRPILAFQWLIVLWPAITIAGIWLSVLAGTDPIVAIKAAWGVDEKAMASGIAAFWLVDRSLRHTNKG